MKKHWCKFPLPCKKGLGFHKIKKILSPRYHQTLERLKNHAELVHLSQTVDHYQPHHPKDHSKTDLIPWKQNQYQTHKKAVYKSEPLSSRINKRDSSLITPDTLWIGQRIGTCPKPKDTRGFCPIHPYTTTLDMLTHQTIGQIGTFKCLNEVRLSPLRCLSIRGKTSSIGIRNDCLRNRTDYLVLILEVSIGLRIERRRDKGLCQHPLVGV